MIRDFSFFVSEAFHGMKRSPVMMFITVATIAVSLSVFGIFSLLTVNINHLTDFLASKLEIRVYLTDRSTRQELVNFQERISNMNGVEKVEFIDKKNAWATFKKTYPNLNLGHLVSDNPLPHSMRVFISDQQKLIDIAKYLQGFRSVVEEVVYGDTLSQRIEKVSYFIKVGGITLVGLLTLATLLIVVNTIRLTVIARQNEIEIMQLVGATHSFIRWPFLFEGFFLGIVGAVLAVLFLIVSYSVVGTHFQQNLPFMPVVVESIRLGKIYAGVTFMGAALGIIGAYLSVSRSLKATLI
jgi:cell division transport system permease protein